MASCDMHRYKWYRAHKILFETQEEKDPLAITIVTQSDKRKILEQKMTRHELMCTTNCALSKIDSVYFGERLRQQYSYQRNKRGGRDILDVKE